jgi:hypothetical protein
MVVRRVYYAWQFIAALVLPVWVLVSHGIILDGIGWDLVLYLVLCPILGVAMLAVAALTVARSSVRAARAVSWLDVAVQASWQIAILAYGFLTSTGLAVGVLLLGIAALWAAGWQLFTETRRLVKAAFSLDPVVTGTYRAETYDASKDAGRVIIVDAESPKGRPKDS